MLEIIDNKKEIAVSYLTGWFIIDLLSIIPLDLLFMLISHSKDPKVS
jgi:hypothetical protein